jgi:hypothetical protein
MIAMTNRIKQYLARLLPLGKLPPLFLAFCRHRPSLLGQLALVGLGVGIVAGAMMGGGAGVVLGWAVGGAIGGAIGGFVSTIISD